LANIGLIYIEKQDFDNAVLYLRNALKIFEEFNFKNEIGHIYTALGSIYLAQENYDLAFESVKKANRIYSETENKAGIAESYLILGEIYFKQKKYGASQSALNLGLSISKKVGYKEYIIDSYLYLFKLDSVNNRYKSALENYRKYSELKDSVFSKEKSQIISDIKERHNLSEKERENIILRKDREIQEVKIKKQKLINQSIVGFLVLMFIVVLLIIFSYRKLRSANKQLKSKNEEIRSQNISLEEYKEEIQAQYEEITIQNEKLEIYKTKLESLVEKRTEELNEALVSAQNSDRLKTLFLENLSHEIRTPMNAISGLSAIMAKDKFNFKPEYLHGVQIGMDDLMNTIDRLVIFSRFQLGTYTVNIEKIRIKEFFEKLKKSVTERKDFLRKTEIKVEFLYDFNDLPEYFSCDQFILTAVINELIENAFKFTEKGVITFTVKYFDKKLCVKVKDTGIGIKEEMKSHVYEFMRKFDKDDVIYRGMGVGLAIVKKALDIISGEVSIDSIYKKGAELTILIPDSEYV